MNSFKLEKFDKKFVTEDIDAINSILQSIMKFSRIKLLCFDVSKHYIVFGASNGSIHIHQRRPTVSFLKIIQSKNTTSLEQIAIAPNEENILIADTNGIIKVLENCMEQNVFQTHKYLELKGKKITVIRWHNDSRGYVGDDKGTVSLISVPSIIRMALLHSPYIALMDLGAPVLQIDSIAHFLLVTTERKSYICDTEREMYKQIGHKDKGSALGACFYNKNDIIPNTIEDFEKEQLYCTRPGMRMWLANFEGEVFYTHKYRDVFPTINEILKLKRKKDTDLEIEMITKPENLKENFGKLFIFNKKYLCTINNQSLYVIDPERNELIFNQFFNNSVEIKLIDHEIFIWDSKLNDLRIFNFYSFEDLMNKIYKTKQFKAGIQFVTRYEKEVMHWCKYAPDIKLLTDLKGKINKIDLELVENLKKLILNVENDEKSELSKLINDKEDSKIGNINDELEQKDEINDDFKIIYKQYQLNKMNNIKILPEFENVLLNLKDDELADLFINFIKYLEEREISDFEFCYDKFLHYYEVTESYTRLAKQKEETVKFVIESYININKNIPICNCSYPLPQINKVRPKYYNLGLILNDLLEKDSKFNVIPHLWLEKLNDIKQSEMEEKLSLIVQYNSIETLQKVKHFVSYDYCDKIVKLFIQLKEGYCLNCNKTFTQDICKQIPNWDTLAINLIQFIGPTQVLKLLLRYNDSIPKEELSRKFYFTCMLYEMKKNILDVPLNVNGTNEENYLKNFLMNKIEKKTNTRLNLKKDINDDKSYVHGILHKP